MRIGLWLPKGRWKFGQRKVEVWAEEKKWWIRGMRGVGKSLNNHLRITYESPMNHLWITYESPMIVSVDFRWGVGKNSVWIRQRHCNHPTITQESPKNHPRITQVCQGIFSVGFFAQCEGDVGLAWEYRSGWYNKGRIGADGTKQRVSVRMV